LPHKALGGEIENSHSVAHVQHHVKKFSARRECECAVVHAPAGLWNADLAVQGYGPVNFNGRPLAIATRPDGRTAAALKVGVSNPIAIVDLVAGNLLQEFRPGSSNGSYAGLIYSADGNHAISARFHGCERSNTNKFTQYSEAKRMNHVQIFGVKGSQATRAAERFFKERRVPIHVVDLKQRSMAAGEIRRFIERFGLEGLLDKTGKPYEDAGLKYLKVSDSELLAKIDQEPRLLRLPLVRASNSNRLSVGQDEPAWKAMLKA
jgi:arsenate reductase